MDSFARTILVVEDEPLLRMVAVEYLEEAGWEVMEFASADDAAAFWRTHDGDVSAVFTDVNMPGELDGLDLADLIARTQPTAAVVVTSGRHQVAPEGLASHVRFLPKPWRSEQLLQALSEVNSATGVQTGSP